MTTLNIDVLKSWRLNIIVTIKIMLYKGFLVRIMGMGLLANIIFNFFVFFLCIFIFLRFSRFSWHIKKLNKNKKNIEKIKIN